MNRSMQSYKDLRQQYNCIIVQQHKKQDQEYRSTLLLQPMIQYQTAAIERKPQAQQCKSKHKTYENKVVTVHIDMNYCQPVTQVTTINTTQ